MRPKLSVAALLTKMVVVRRRVIATKIINAIIKTAGAVVFMRAIFVASYIVL